MYTKITMFTNTMALVLAVIFLVLNVYYFTFVAPTEFIEDITHITEDNGYQFNMSALLQLDGLDYIDGGQNRTRVKRKSAGKFSEAASMGPMKCMQLFFTFLRNLFTTDPIGGVHPMSRSVPKPVVKLFKEKIIKTLFPNLSPDH